MAAVRKPREIFLSHASPDQRAAERIAQILRDEYGLKVWFSPSNLRGADAWHDEIGKALIRCDCFVVLITPAAIRSPWVKHELVFALSERRYRHRIVPVKLKTCDPMRLSWVLRNIQIINASTSKPADTAGTLAALWKVKRKQKKNPNPRTKKPKTRVQTRRD